MRREASQQDVGRDVTEHEHARCLRAPSGAAVALRRKSQPDKSSIIDKLIEEAGGEEHFYMKIGPETILPGYLILVDRTRQEIF